MSEVTEEMVRIGAEACARRIGCYGMSGKGYMCSDPLDDNCECGKYARAALEAAIPLVRERCAKIAEQTTAFDDNVHRSAGCGTTGERIAAAIRSDNGGETKDA